MKRFRLMQRVNVEGLYGTVQEALPHLVKNLKERGGRLGRIIVVSPPIYSRFFRGKTAYAVGKVGMSVLVKGLGMDFEREGLVVGGGMAVSAVWPAVVSISFSTFFCCFLLLFSIRSLLLFFPVLLQHPWREETRYEGAYKEDELQG
jgi:NAD(P)-dependent dehydrogenase (short-subunit alcohol dehydrogenase family)